MGEIKQMREMGNMPPEITLRQMRSLFFFIALAVFSGAPMFASGAASDKLTIEVPPDRSFVENGLISIVVSVREDGSDSMRITVNKKEYPLINKAAGYACRGVNLSQGYNTIEVAVLKKGKIVEEKKCSLFFRSDLSDRYDMPPPEFKRYNFHSKKNEKRCVPCHEMRQKASDENPDNPQQSSCFVCHRRITEFKFVHGPASVWACPTCHVRKSEVHQYDVLKPDSMLCSSCHVDAIDNWKERKYWHGPYSGGSCTLCHDPHASDFAFWLRKKPTDLCITCHTEKASGVHVVSGFSERGHPVQGKPDPRTPGKELSCASCHNPHTSDFADLLFADISNKLAFCRSCHKF